MAIAQRVGSLEQVAKLAAAGEDFAYALCDFLDGFYSRPDAGALTAEPMRLSGIVTDGTRLDVYLAAVAEHLSREQRWSVPSWARQPHRYLEQPWFGMRTLAGRMLLLADSPAAFRVRNLFVSADALKRV